MVKKLIWGLSAALVCITAACTKQQAVGIANGGVQVAVDLCEEAPQLVPAGTPAGTLVGLLCPALDGSSSKIEVLIDQVIWNSMKAAKANGKKTAKGGEIDDGF